MSKDATAARLAARTSGPVWSRAAADQAGYDEGRSGFNSALDHQPALVLAATTPADIVEGVRFAAESGLPVDLHVTGHGAHRSMDGGLLIVTRRLADVDVDPGRRAGARPRWSDGGRCHCRCRSFWTDGAGWRGARRRLRVLHARGRPGSARAGPRLRCRRARRLEVVTADGQERTVTPEQLPELFWALRGGGGNLAAVTAIEIELLPVSEIYGGGLFFSADRAPSPSRPSVAR